MVVINVYVLLALADLVVKQVCSFTLTRAFFCVK
jgi:hypothetical protein